MSNSKEKWNAKYSARSSFSMEPDQFLVDHRHLLKDGSVLDFACGTGRNAIWLAQNGFDVHGVDISEVGLKQLDAAAVVAHVDVQAMVLDLEDLEQWKNLATYDNIVVNMYKPDHEALMKMPELLNGGGRLLICTHNWQQVEVGKFKKAFCLMPNELIDLNWDLEQLKYSSFETKTGFYDGYIFINPD